MDRLHARIRGKPMSISANIKALDRPLTFGDPEQVAAVNALGQGLVPCRDCGYFYQRADTQESIAGFCAICYGIHSCPDCGEYQGPKFLNDELCEWCKAEKAEPK